MGPPDYNTRRPKLQSHAASTHLQRPHPRVNVDYILIIHRLLAMFIVLPWLSFHFQ